MVDLGSTPHIDAVKDFEPFREEPNIDEWSPGDINKIKELISSGKQEESQSPTPSEEVETPGCKIYSCEEFLAIQHANIEPLIGSPDDALLVRGEGMMIPGVGGVGKTMFTISLAMNMAVGENVLRWDVPRPLRVLVYQAELPAQFFQQRIRNPYDSYELADQKRALLIAKNLFIADVKVPFDIAAKGETASEIVSRDVEENKIDIVIVDPFLSFFRGNENDNNEVRRALDSFKHQVAEQHQCGLIITDHQPKYSESNKNPEQVNSMRGAGAKRDWAATVIALNKMKTPEGQYGTFIKATVDKMRYGKLPTDPFKIRRDDFSFRHSLFRSNDIELHEVAKVLDDAGSGLSKRAFNDAISETYSVSNHEARKLIENAIDDRWIVTSPGPKNATLHYLGEKYCEWRNEQK